jgi:hypothetical protein
LDRAEIYELLSQNAAVLKEDISLIDTGFIKLNVFGADVSQDHLSRLKGNLARLEAILEAWGDEPSNA